MVSRIRTWLTSRRWISTTRRSSRVASPTRSARRWAAAPKGRKVQRPQLALFEAEAPRKPEPKVKAKAAAPVANVVPAPEITVPPPAASPAPARRATAEALGQKQREISVSEFFVKN